MAVTKDIFGDDIEIADEDVVQPEPVVQQVSVAATVKPAFEGTLVEPAKLQPVKAESTPPPAKVENALPPAVKREPVKPAVNTAKPTAAPVSVVSNSELITIQVEKAYLNKLVSEVALKIDIKDINSLIEHKEDFAFIRKCQDAGLPLKEMGISDNIANFINAFVS